MKFRNFELIEVVGASPINWKFRAMVDVIHGFIRKKTERVEIYREYGGSWFFAATGKFTPRYEIEGLVRAYEAKHGKPLQSHEIKTENMGVNG